MKIFILDKFKITKFSLPEKIEDSFLIPYKSYNNPNENLITVEAIDENWRIKSNGNVNIMDGTTMLDKVILENYSYYTLKILGQQEIVTLFALPSKNEESYKLEFKNLKSITIGSSSNTNISYRNNLTGEVHAEIKFVNNDWYIAGSSNDSYRTYINGERILTAKLNVGDVIFINGLRIIWMNSFIKINNPKQMVSVKGLNTYEELEVVDNTKYTPVKDDEVSVDLYKEDEYFYHIPRIRSVLENEEVIIDPPPGSENQEELPLILTLGSSLTMAATSLMSCYTVVMNLSTGKVTLLTALPSIITCAAMIIGSLIFPRITSSYQKRKRKKREKKRQRKYQEYLLSKENDINVILRKQAQILKENNPTSDQCISIVQNRNRMLWSREINYDDFCKVRLGMGNIPALLNIKAPEKHFTLDEDNLFEAVYEVVNKSKMLNNVPITFSFIDKNIVSFIFNCKYKMKYIQNIILQLVSLQSPVDLKLVILTDKENASNWEFAKFLPHCWSDDKSKRFFATTLDDMKDISNYLEDELKNRKELLKGRGETSEEIKKEDSYKNFPPYYIVITDNYKFAKNTPIIDMILKSSDNLGFSFVTFGNSMKNLPNNCNEFIEIGEKDCCILEKDLNSQSQQIFVSEYDNNLNMKDLSISLSNIPLMTKDGMTSLPNSLSFLDMYGVSKIEQLNISNKWKNNNPVTSLAVPIGVHSDLEQFKLDLHEKFHGPHGLIAGSTGSGKSEFIITYILSMCVNFHPYEVQFVLIDYKGGGLAGAFENKETGVKVPHLVGTITNLDTAEMNRTLVSISSELKRRQRKFNEVKDKLDESTMDIYKYQRLYREGLISEPMAHLFIISDEFAELKSQQPEFLNELVSTARIGRSLGVHLILATQKPSGVVNDQIWSNSKFKVCLKVQDRGDSMEMLKRPEAASIKETGRFYLQVGYDDYFDIGQSGWGGAKYIPSDKIIKKVDDSINFVDDVGNVTKSINEIVKKENVADLGDQLTNIVKYIYNLALKDNIVSNKLWLDSIPSLIYINDLKNKYNYKPTPFVINPVIGEYDNPGEQAQGLLNVKISCENTLIYGQGGSGKENLLITLIYSSIVEHTPDEINFYIIDCGAETLKMFYKMPHVGDIATVDENDKIMGILTIIDEELERRKDLFADYAGSYQNYIENSGNRLPIIELVINNYEIFSETYGKVADILPTLYRDGAKYGINFILSCVTTNSVRSRVMQYFKNKISLQLADNNDYRNLLNSPKGLVPAKFFGRGLVALNDTAYEFQTAYICNPNDINKQIQSAATQLNNAYTTRAKKVKSIPNEVTIDTIKDNIKGLDSLPIGFDVNTKEVFNYNFTDSKLNIITGEKINEEITFLNAIIKEISLLSNVNLKILDFTNTLNIPNITIYKNNFDNALALINNEIVAEKNSKNSNMYIIYGIGDMKNKLSDVGRQIANNLFMASSAFQKSYFILVDNYSSYKNLQLEQWYQSQIDNSNGIWLGQNVSSQMAISANDLTMEDRKINFPGLAFAINKGKHIIIKYVIDMEETHEK